MSGTIRAATAVGLILALFGPMLLAAADQRFLGSPFRLAPQLLSLGAYLAIVAAVLLIIVRFERQSLASIGLHPVRGPTLAWGAALAAFFMGVFAPAAAWLLAHFELGDFSAGLAKTAGMPVWYLAVVVVIGGIAEELLYRGYAVERLAAWTGSYGLAGALSVVIFGLAHLPMWGWGPVLATLLSGAVATAFYVWRRDLIALMIAHVVTDMAGTVLPRLAAG